MKNAEDVPLSFTSFMKIKLMMNATTEAVQIMNTLPRGEVESQFAAPNAIPERTTSAVPMRSITAELLIGSLCFLGFSERSCAG